jgi:hypothetical protein
MVHAPGTLKKISTIKKKIILLYHLSHKTFTDFFIRMYPNMLPLNNKYIQVFVKIGFGKN